MLLWRPLSVLTVSLSSSFTRWNEQKNISKMISMAFPLLEQQEVKF